jgi:hypothetical protein
MIWKYLTQRDAKELTAWTNDKLNEEPRIVIQNHPSRAGPDLG